MFLGIQAKADDFKNEDKEFTVSFGDNAFTDLVELPDLSSPLVYANVICGIIRGALKTVLSCIITKIVEYGCEVHVCKGQAKGG